MLAHAQIKDVISFVKISEEETFEPKHSHIIITRTCVHVEMKMKESIRHDFQHRIKHINQSITLQKQIKAFIQPQHDTEL